MEEQTATEVSEPQDTSNNILQVIFIFAVFYVGIFSLIVVDEVILGTRYLLEYVPEDVRHVVFIIFYPLILIVRYIIGI